MLRKVVLSFLIFLLVFGGVSSISAEGKKKGSNGVEIPEATLNIGKENTYPNSNHDSPSLQPSELTKELIETSNVKIQSPDLIRMLNESSISSNPLSLGFKATVYLGEWALNYQSDETNTNWEYQNINTNRYDNRGVENPAKMYYRQEQQKQVKGGLTADIPNGDEVKKMMLLKAQEKTKLPLAFTTVVGAGTKKEREYMVPAKKFAQLHSYVPAVSEKGKVTYGEVYLVIKGTKRTIVVKNVTSQGIGAWIPVQDHLSFTYHVS
ncbi:YfkD famly protein [Priestia endophytica]|jgi:hypothetical protein|uniref:YfkD-like protein n=2 Tax=Priestia endophytica TaxID=135735 RepID=A0AAX1QEF6_9BACI|nr:YfkD famly protein [Priestia endophytica]KAB2492508.1 hypothetical protein F8155_16840 [Priestia endophytica]KYG35464.1 hypothetical protein AZF06_19100 [Priestia endophytica]MBG9810339.1 hypothetical protein [Priestia endophytica]MCM3540509.1 YfkD family protein [Priestia endophytica]RAS78551.1 hypothetical protein A4R27_16795 [Priestia endophytica]